MLQQPGLYLSVPRPSGGDAFVTSVADEEDAAWAGIEAFVMLDYPMDATVYATLFRIAPTGGLASSEAFPISGPEVEKERPRSI